MAKVQTTGEKTVVAAAAPPLVATAAVSLMHVGVASETFSVPTAHGEVHFLAGQRTIVEASIKALVVASDKAVTWDS